MGTGTDPEDDGSAASVIAVKTATATPTRMMAEVR
jgi:hypothetical protein